MCIRDRLFTIVDLCEQLLAFFARASQNDGAVVGAHLVSVFLNGAVVPVLRILGILVDGVAKGGQESVSYTHLGRSGRRTGNGADSGRIRGNAESLYGQ